MNEYITESITIAIRQENSLNSLVFNRILDEIIKKFKNHRGYKMEDKEIQIVCWRQLCANYGKREQSTKVNTRVH